MDNLEKYEYPPDLSCTIGRTSRLQICSEPNEVKDLFYFKAFDKESDKFCRISLTEPRIIGADDETLELTEKDIMEIIDLFHQECLDVFGTPLGFDNWKLMVISNNNEGITSRDDPDTNIFMPDDAQMPDYTKLL